jgi:hypothetical protein
MLFPSNEKEIQLHSMFGTYILSNSYLFLEFQIRISLKEQVAKTSENPLKNKLKLHWKRYIVDFVKMTSITKFRG